MTDSVTSLLVRIERLEAVAEITRLSADYCFGADLRDVDLFLSVWSDDGVWRVRDDLAFVGREQIRMGIEKQWETTVKAFHWATNPSIAMDGDGLRARARFDVHAEIQLLDQSWQSLAGTYHDTYVKSEHGWRLRTRMADMHLQRPILG